MKILKSKIFWLSLVLIGSLVFFYNYGTPWNLFKYNKEFENYLEKKYHKDFVISDISYDFIHNTYNAHAYEQNNQEIQFSVWQNIRNKEIIDLYDFETLRLEAKREITPLIQKYLPGNTKVNVELISTERKEIQVNIWTTNAVKEDLKNKIKKEIESSEYTTSQLFFIKDNR